MYLSSFLLSIFLSLIFLKCWMFITFFFFWSGEGGIRGEGSFPLAASGCLEPGVHHYKAKRMANSSRALRAFTTLRWYKNFFTFLFCGPDMQMTQSFLPFCLLLGYSIILYVSLNQLIFIAFLNYFGKGWK